MIWIAIGFGVWTVAILTGRYLKRRAEYERVMSAVRYYEAHHPSEW